MTSVLGDLSIALTEEQGMLLDVARGFVADKAPIDAVRAQLETASGFDASVWQEMVELGWTGIALPESVGGSAMGVGSVVPVVESLGAGLLGTPLINSTLAGQLLLRAGGASVEPWLQRITEGEIATVALLDSGDWGATNTALDLTADGVLNGRKLMVGDATVADIFVVVCQQDGQPALAVVERSALSDGAVKANTLIDLTKRSGNVDFSGVTAVFSCCGDTVVSALRDFHLLGAMLVAAEAAGSAARCLDGIVDYLKTRKQFGKLIGSYQALKHPTVDIYCGMEDARSFVYHAATHVTDDSLSLDAELACRMAKAQASDVMSYAGDRSVQFHGGIGFTWDCDSTLFIRRAQWTAQAFGDPAHHRKHLGRLLLSD